MLFSPLFILLERVRQFLVELRVYRRFIQKNGDFLHRIYPRTRPDKDLVWCRRGTTLDLDDLTYLQAGRIDSVLPACIDDLTDLHIYATRYVMHFDNIFF